ncbi:MAG: G5 domain-containing protein, partial [Desulfocucumaceae bacterium]
VYIISSTEKDKGYVRITFAGKKEDSKVYRMETAIKTISPGVVLRGNSHLRRGQSIVVNEGSEGYEAVVGRVSVSHDGEEKKENISTDYYQPEPRIIEVGVTSGKK